MSIKPGSSVTSPSSMSSATFVGASTGFTAEMRLPSITTTAGEPTSPASTSAQRAARSTVTPPGAVTERARNHSPAT